MTKILTVAVIKGGTGKTTTCAAIAQAGAVEGKKVLCIDLDPQANLTVCLGADTNQAGALELMQGTPVQELIQETEQGIDTIAASIDLSVLDKAEDLTLYVLAEAIKPVVKKYDLIVIDTPPRLSITTYNALQACNGLLIPMEADIHSLQGMYQILDIADLVKRSNKKLKVLGCIITRYNRRTNINRLLQRKIQEKAEENGCSLLTEIRQGVAVQEAQALQKNLFEYAPRSSAAVDYMELYKTIIK